MTQTVIFYKIYDVIKDDPSRVCDKNTTVLISFYYGRFTNIHIINLARVFICALEQGPAYAYHNKPTSE